MKTAEMDRETTAAAAVPENCLCPPADITERDDHFSIEVELPGVHSDQVDLQVDEDELRLVAVRGDGLRGSPSSTYLEKERAEGTFARVFRLGPFVDRQGIQGTLTDGVLRILVPKAAAAMPRRISIHP
jgi:HSP20 family protein